MTAEDQDYVCCHPGITPVRITDNRPSADFTRGTPRPVNLIFLFYLPCPLSPLPSLLFRSTLASCSSSYGDDWSAPLKIYALHKIQRSPPRLVVIILSLCQWLVLICPVIYIKYRSIFCLTLSRTFELVPGMKRGQFDISTPICTIVDCFLSINRSVDFLQCSDNASLAYLWTTRTISRLIYNMRRLRDRLLIKHIFLGSYVNVQRSVRSICV